MLFNLLLIKFDFFLFCLDLLEFPTIKFIMKLKYNKMKKIKNKIQTDAAVSISISSENISLHQ